MVFLAFYSKCSSIFEKKSLFFVTFIPFHIFFLLFDIIIFPNRDFLQPRLHIDKSEISANVGAKDILYKVLNNWISAFYYIVAEIYSSVSTGVLFWKFANEFVPVYQAKRFYPLFAQVGGMAPIFSGQFLSRFASKSADFGQSLHRITIAVTISGVMTCIFYYFCTFILEEESCALKQDIKKCTLSINTNKIKNKKLSIRQSFRLLLSSLYLRLIGTIVIGYGLTSNFIELIWKSLVKKEYPHPLQYQEFLGNFSSVVGVGTFIVTFFGTHVIRILGWRTAAVATPIIMATLAVPFFGCILFRLERLNHLHLAVITGTVQTLLCKMSRNVLFDPTTQMAYIPLDEDLRVKGKAAIDMLGSRLGKGGSALIQQSLLFIFSDIIDSTQTVVILFYSILFVWILSVSRLNDLFIAKAENQ